jgi:tRNA-dihydrouridine synthase A
MIDWTYVHFRVFMRILAPQALLYTEMQTPGAIEHNPARALSYHFSELPLLALQLGGSDVDALVRAAKFAEVKGFSEINLNLGCPSDKVQSGRFGACLMREPVHVATCIAAMKDAVSIPVTAKTRIGLDHDDSYDYFSSFVEHLVKAGCDKLIVHARKAWLHGLNPKQNRTIPPLHYEYVYRIKESLPHIPVVLNGNVQSMDAISAHLNHVDGVMIGRLACQDPYAIAKIHHALYPDTLLLTRTLLLQSYMQYLQTMDEINTPISLVLKPILNLAHALPNARAWKTQLLTIRHVTDVRGFEQALENLANMESPHEKYHG